MPSKAELEKQVGTQFPQLAALYRGIPELWNVLIWCVAGGIGAMQTQEAIQNTTYYKTTTDKKRAWDSLRATNPGEAVKLQKDAQSKVALASMRIGINLSHDQLALISQGMVEQGQSDQQMQDILTGLAHGVPAAQRQPGEFTAAMTKVRNIADQFAMPVNDKEAADLAQRFLLGGQGATGADETSLSELFRTRASILYPTLKPQMDAGVTIQQAMQPYKTLAANELGISADSITFNDPKWRAMLEGTPMKGKDADEKHQMKPLSLADWHTKIRTDEQYGFDRTEAGAQAAHGIAAQLGKMFGKEGN